MKTLRLLTLSIVFMTGVFLSCYDAGGIPGSKQDNTAAVVTDTSIQTVTVTQSCPLPGGKTELAAATDANTGESYEYDWNDKIKIQSTFGGETINIRANVYIPVAKTTGEKFPMIVMANSWGLEEHEYLYPAVHFAKKGYVVLCFSQRGWYYAEGKATFSGPADFADFKNVLDWAVANLPIDVNNIGSTGVSLGGGAALQHISLDSRVKTCAALSPYIDFFRSMYSQDTPRLFWGLILVGSSLMANADPVIYKIWGATLNHTDIDFIKTYLAGRSPVDYVSEVNRMNKPVYISTNFEDHMFQPDTAIEYFNKLTVDHKRMDINVGTHFSAEMPGLLGFKCYAYTNVDKWFDYWLKGIDTGILPDKKKSAVVTMEEKNNLVRTTYDMDDLTLSNGIYQWPAKSIATETMYCEPKGTYTNGKLSYTASTKKGMNTIYSDVLTSLADMATWSTQAGGMVFPILEQFKMPVICDLSLLNRATTIVYEAPVLTSVKKLRGAAQATLRMSLSRSNGQVVFYLYDVNENGYGTFITHGFRTWYSARAGYVMEETIPFVATAYDIPAGHHLALVVDTSDFNYTRPDWLPFLLTLHHGTSGQSKITLSYEKQ